MKYHVHNNHNNTNSIMDEAEFLQMVKDVFAQILNFVETKKTMLDVKVDIQVEALPEMSKERMN